MKFKVGDRVKYLDDDVFGTIEHIREGLKYLYLVKRDDGRYSACMDAQLEHENVVSRESKKSLNFWEARCAALKGKKVRMVGDFDIYDASDFKEHISWPGSYIESVWVIVEEPKVLYTYLNTYEDCHGQALNTKGQADVNSKGRTGCIEIITDKQGRLISARNV